MTLLRIHSEVAISETEDESPSEQLDAPKSLVSVTQPDWRQALLYNLVEGEHVLRIMRTRSAQQGFVIDGRVEQSTAPDFAGKFFTYVFSYRFALSIAYAPVSQLFEAAGNDFTRIVTSSVFSQDETVNAVVRAITLSKKFRKSPEKFILSTSFRKID